MLTKHTEKKLDGIYTTMLQAIMNKSWKKHPMKKQLHNSTKTYLPSQKPSKKDEQDMWDSAGEARTNS